MRLFKRWQTKTNSAENEVPPNDDYILATDYLELLANEHDQDISSLAQYLKDLDPAKSFRNFYYFTNGEFKILEDTSAYQSHQVRKFLDDLIYSNFHKMSLIINDSFKQTYERTYIKKHDVKDIRIDYKKLAWSKEVPSNGSLSSYLSYFNIPQIAALILGINLEDIYITDSNYAYYANEDTYPEELYSKYMQTVNCLKADLISEGLVNRIIDIGFRENNSLDLTQTFINRNSLERFLNLKGYSLNNLIRKQSSLVKNYEENNLLREQNSTLEEKLREAEKTVDILANELKETERVDEGQGDSFLILGAVMSCIKEAAKKNYTQDILVDLIIDKYGNVPGISKSTLSKKFPKAKAYLKENIE